MPPPGVAGTDGAGAASPFPEKSAFFVAGPTLPSTSRPCFFWKALILATVPVPIFPSTSAPTAFWTAAWSRSPSDLYRSSRARYSKCHASFCRRPASQFHPNRRPFFRIQSWIAPGWMSIERPDSWFER